ncbi:MAG: hypothetical protein AABY07_00955 [Nanoarchaeota archaeon]
MFRTIIIDCNVNGDKKPIEFYTVSALEYYLGWGKAYIKTLETMGRLPQSPHVQLRKDGFVKVRIYTKTQLVELVELVENFYPVLYRGRDVVKKEYYKQKMYDYCQKVRQLQDKWDLEDYLSKEPATYRPFTKGKRNWRMIE